MKTEQIVARISRDALRASGNRRIVSFSAKNAHRMLPAMPIYVQYYPMPVEVSFEWQNSDVLFRFRYAESSGDYMDWGLDAYHLREVFLGVKTPAEALEFLSLSGHFLRLRERDEEQSHETMTWSAFQKWQELVSVVLTEGPLAYDWLGKLQNSCVVQMLMPEHLGPLLKGISMTETNWLMGHPDQIIIRSDSPYLHQESQENERKALEAEIMVSSTLEAILATAYVDGLSGVNYQLCALPDCQRVYEVSSKHQRQYCSQACAHKASVRKRRAETKRLKEAAAQQTTKSKGKKGKR